MRGAHPSFLELDRHALGVSAAGVAAHVATCEACQAHLRLVEPGGAAADVPAWALAQRRRPPRLRWSVSFAAAAAACALVLWLAVGHRGGGGIETKGGPELWLYVKRGERVDLWNGTDPVRPGDRLRLKLQPDRYRHISVFGGAGRLYDAPLVSGQLTSLPFSWEVDAQPGDETLVVILGPESVAPEEVADVLARGDAARYWSRRLVLAKAAQPGDGAPP